jgi:hypothetical protein
MLVDTCTLTCKCIVDAWHPAALPLPVNKQYLASLNAVALVVSVALHYFLFVHKDFNLGELEIMNC